MKKTELAMILNDLNLNGISKVALSFCTHLDKERFSITIISGEPAAQPNLDECRDHGIKVQLLPSRKKSPTAYWKALYKYLGKNHFDIVHVHGNSTKICVELLIAKLRGIKVRAAHSHNTTCNNVRIHNALKPLFRLGCTHGFACSEMAGKWLFGNRKFYVLPNGFEISRFRFDPAAREETRRELGISDNFVLCHIGRFNNQKNHRFLLKVFEQTAAADPSAVLLLVGNGPLFDEIGELIKKHPYSDRIRVLNETDAPEKIYCASDLFLLPSTHEGLGIVLLEAQMNGLHCIASDVTEKKEVKITGNISFLPIGADDAAAWKDRILELKNSPLDRAEVFERNLRRESFYDIESNTRYLESLYEKFLKK